MFSNKFSILVLSLAACSVATLGTGCTVGKKIGAQKKVSSSTPNTSSGGNFSFNGDDDDNDNSTPDPRLQYPAPYLHTMHGTGMNVVTYTVAANQYLRVRFTPHQQDRPIAGTGYQVPYYQLSVYIAADTAGHRHDLSQVTDPIDGDPVGEPSELLSNGAAAYLYGPQRASHIFDLSGSFTNACATGDTTCRNQVRVIVNWPQYDGLCLAGQFQACPYNVVYNTHPWTGRLEIETDDTRPLQ